MLTAKQRNNGVWLSLVERYVRDVEAAGSNPVTPTPWQGHMTSGGYQFCIDRNGVKNAGTLITDESSGFLYETKYRL